MENKKEMLLYNAGGCLMLGEIMQRKAEQQKLEELEIPMFNPINADHNDKKKNKNDGGLAERIVANDTEHILNATHVMIEPLPSSLGTTVELGQIFQHNLIMDMLDEAYQTSENVSDFGVKVREIMQKYPKKKVYPHYHDIRRVEGITESEDRRSLGINQYVYGVCLALSDGKGFYEYDEIYADLDNVIKRAHEAGVQYILNAGGKFDELPRQLEICKKYPETMTVTGVHPHDAAAYKNVTTEEVLKNTLLPQVVAIGECGLDYFYDFSPKDEQIKVLKKMIAAAQQSGLPIIIHSREAEDDTAEILITAYKQKAFTGVLHCYSSAWELASSLLDIGFYVSASGIITFKNSGELRASFAKVPEERLLLETDSPYLAPIPLRGKMNEPSFMVHTAKCLATIKGLDLNDISAITTNNFFKLFAKAQRG